MLPRTFLSEETVLTLKRDLWDGVLTQAAVAKKYDISQSMVSQIFRGTQWPDIPWPDGSMGHIPMDRYTTVIRSKRRKARYHAEAQHQRPPSQEAMAVAAEVEQLLSTMDTNLSSELASTLSRKNSKTVGKRKERQRGLCTYLDIRDRDPAHPIVQELAENKNPYLELALRKVLNKMPEKEWQTGTTVDMIRKLADKIKEENEK